MRFAAVIAAAGISSRMHEFKPMMCLGDSTVIENVIRGLRNAGVSPIVVVTGYRSDILRSYLDKMQVVVAENKDYAHTDMFDSLRIGIRAIPGEYDAVFVTPGDVPLVQTETLLKMQACDAQIARPICGGKTGHPLMISRTCIEDILAYTGKNGLGGAVQGLGVPIVDIPVDDVGILMDADTPEDYKALCRREMALNSRGFLWPEIQIHIAKCDTVLNPMIAQLLEMIDLTGSIRSACTCMHMSYSKGWKKLGQIEKELGYPLVERSPGGMSGGGSTLSEKGKRLLRAYQLYRTQMHEIALRMFHDIFPDDLHS